MNYDPIPVLRPELYLKSNRSSHSSDTSSAYSGSDTMHSVQSSLDAEEVDLSGLVESVVDSDEDEDLAESIDVRRCFVPRELVCLGPMYFLLFLVAGNFLPMGVVIFLYMFIWFVQETHVVYFILSVNLTFCVKITTID